MTNEEKTENIISKYETKYNDTSDLLWTDIEDVAMEMALWKDEQFKQQTEKLKEFENWLYNMQSEYKYERMYEELVGLNAVIQKFEELGL